MARGPVKNSYRQKVLAKFRQMAAGDSFPVSWKKANLTRVYATQYSKDSNVRLSVRTSGRGLRCIRVKGRYWQ